MNGTAFTKLIYSVCFLEVVRKGTKVGVLRDSIVPPHHYYTSYRDKPGRCPVRHHHTTRQILWLVQRIGWGRYLPSLLAALIIAPTLFGANGIAPPENSTSGNHTGRVSLDRSVYPVPFGSVKDFFPGASESPDTTPRGQSIFPVHRRAVLADHDLNIDAGSEEIGPGDLIVYIEVNDPDFTLDSVVEETIAQGDHGPIKIMVRRGTETLLLATAGGLAPNNGVITQGSDIIKSITRELGPIHETAPDSGLFEIALPIRYTDGPESSVGPVTPGQGYTPLNGKPGVLGRFDQEPQSDSYCILQGDAILVEYTDPADNTGSSRTLSEAASFHLHSGFLLSNKTEYVIDDDMHLSLIELDLNLNSKEAESYTLDLVLWKFRNTRLTIGPLGGEIAAFAPEFMTFRESGDSTGIFDTHIKIPKRLKGEFVPRGEEISLEYTDWGPSHANFVGDEEREENLVVVTSNFGATVELDKKRYSWTDKVYITIVAPAHNFDSSVIDDIGNSDVDPIRISTRGFHLDKYKLLETGVDTGIFVGEVTLTGFTHDADGDPNTGDKSGFDTRPRTGPASAGGPDDGLIQSSDDDGLIVSFEFSGDETVVDSALIRWNTGVVEWLEPVYQLNETGAIQVSDPDMNLDPEALDSFQVRVRSETDTGGIDITVTETDFATGIFGGSVTFSQDDSSEAKTLYVTPGDTITADYNDHTLPDPFTTADDLLLESTAFIEGPNSPVKIIFDQETYTWTDKVGVSIIAPNHNLSANEIDTIGSHDTNTIRITTQDHELESGHVD